MKKIFVTVIILLAFFCFDPARAQKQKAIKASEITIDSIAKLSPFMAKMIPILEQSFIVLDSFEFDKGYYLDYIEHEMMKEIPNYKGIAWWFSYTPIKQFMLDTLKKLKEEDYPICILAEYYPTIRVSEAIFLTKAIALKVWRENYYYFEKAPINPIYECFLKKERIYSVLNDDGMLRCPTDKLISKMKELTEW